MRRSGRRGWRSGAPALIRWCGASLRRRVRSAPPCRSLRRCSATGRLTAITLVRIGACGASRDGWISSVPWTTSTRTLRSVIWSAHRKLSQAGASLSGHRSFLLEESARCGETRRADRGYTGTGPVRVHGFQLRRERRGGSAVGASWHYGGLGLCRPIKHRGVARHLARVSWAGRPCHAAF